MMTYKNHTIQLLLVKNEEQQEMDDKNILILAIIKENVLVPV